MVFNNATITSISNFSVCILAKPIFEASIISHFQSVISIIMLILLV